MVAINSEKLLTGATAGLKASRELVQSAEKLKQDIKEKKKK